ncbi:hypothetical protein GCM10010252_62750 [Streptomyces aureoverticillatus]|nr:hypothetical protein GCM10010252_62750 [Streptomyces aureoverticillatus]
MKPVERRLMRELPVLRRHMTYSTVLALLTAGLVVAQAVLLAAVLADGFAGGGVLIAPLAVLVALAAVMALRALLVWARGLLAQRAAADAKRTLRDRVTERLGRTGPLRPAARRHGETVTLLTRGLDALDPYVVGYLPTMTATAVVPLTVVGWLLWADWTSALVVIVTLPLIPVFGALVGMHTAQRTARQWGLLARLGGHFLDVVAGLPTLRAFGRERHQTRVVGEMADAHRRATMRTLRVAFLSSFVLETVATLSVALVAVPVGLRLLRGELDLRTALTVLFLAPEAYLPLRAAGAAFHDSAEGIAVAERVFAMLDDEDGPHALEGVRATERAAVHALASHARTTHLRLDEVTVHHPGRTAPALRHASLAVAPGEHVALAGPSGAGKSTLLALFLGFVTPASGRVEVGGTDLARLDPDAWRTQVAWVPQRPHLFAASVADNIRLGRPDASDAEVRRAARAASADLFIEELPAAYDTVLGEHGAGLSAGQRQRVALARAFLKDAPVLLLDEPTAHLDPESEAAVTRATVELMRGRTAVVVAHRTSLLPHADRIVTVRAGSLDLDPSRPTALAVSHPAPLAAFRPAPLSAPQPAPTEGLLT